MFITLRIALCVTAAFLCEPLDLREQLRRHRLRARIDHEHALVADCTATFDSPPGHEPDLPAHVPGLNLPVLARRRIGIGFGRVQVHRFTKRRLWRLSLTGNGDGNAPRQPKEKTSGYGVFHSFSTVKNL